MLARRWIRALPMVAALTLTLWAAPPHIAAADLELFGTRLSPRQVTSMLAPALRAPADSAALAAGLERLVARLQDEGHLDARATAAWVGPERLRVDVSEGRAYLFARVILRVSSPESAAFAGAIQLSPGEPASASRLAAAMDAAVDRAAESGHPYAQIAVSGWDVDSSGVTLTLSGTLGPDVRFAGARFDGARVTQTRLLERAAGPLAGPYRQSVAEAARGRVEHLGLFRRVELGDPEGAADFHQATVVMRVEERPYNQFEGVLGSQGAGNIVGLAHVELENLGGSGRAAAVRWESRGSGVSQAFARYREPLVLGLPAAAEVTLEAETHDTLFTLTRAGLAARWSLSASERLEAGVEGARVVQSTTDVREATTQTTRLALLDERLDDRLAPRRGRALRLEASQSFTRQQLRAGDRRTVRSSAAELSLAVHRPLGSSTGLALELRGAGRIGSERVLPFYDRYPLGGAASLRGYDEEAFRVDRYALARLEARAFLPGAQYAFLFWDHAAAATRLPTATGDRLQILERDGFGAGLSLAASAGRVGVTYGVASGNGPLEGKLHIQILAPF
jgi:translocation and assembly module TamA